MTRGGEPQILGGKCPLSPPMVFVYMHHKCIYAPQIMPSTDTCTSRHGHVCTHWGYPLSGLSIKYKMNSSMFPQVLKEYMYIYCSMYMYMNECNCQLEMKAPVVQCLDVVYTHAQHIAHVHNQNIDLAAN